MAPATGTVPPLGRDEEFETLAGAVTAVASGRGGIVWLEGEPGIGKSTLVTAAFGEARRLRCRAHRAVGDELGQRLPLRALIDALAAESEAAAEIATLLQTEAGGQPVGGPDADTGGLAPGTDAVPAAVERFLVVIDRLCAVAPLVLAFDDLQWADEASLLAWHRLSLAVDQIPLLLISSCRPVPVRPEVVRLRRSVESRGAAVLSLGPLTVEAVSGLVARLARRRAGATAAPGRRSRRR